MKPNYGIDAPGLVRAFFLIAVTAAVLSGSAFLFSNAQPWAFWLGVILAIPALYTLGMGCFMIWESMVTKLEERETILDLVAWKGDEVVLDVGCGRGLMMVGAARRLTTGRAVGVDIWSAKDQSDNVETAAITNAQIEGVIDLVSVQTADMRQLPFADHSFDVIVSNWVVHNVEPQEERAKALSEMMRVLRPNGTILLADIVNRQEYLTEFSRLGMSNTRLVVRSVWRDWFCRTVSFGAFQPATIVARR